MKHTIKSFSKFIAESQSTDSHEALRELYKLGLLSEIEAVRWVADELSLKFGVKLVQNYDSWQDQNPDEESGHHLIYSTESPLFPDGEDPVIAIYEDLTVQFFWDSTPMPTRHHSSKERRSMLQFLESIPLPWQTLDRQDWEELVDSVREELGYDDEE